MSNKYTFYLIPHCLLNLTMFYSASEYSSLSLLLLFFSSYRPISRLPILLLYLQPGSNPHHFIVSDNHNKWENGSALKSQCEGMRETQT